MTDVCLVQMPFGAVERPAIGLSILHASLKGTGISSTVRYANIEFAEKIGPDLYNAIAISPNEELLGEWCFSGVAFPDYRPDHETYLEEINGIFDHYGFRLFKLYQGGVDVKKALLGVRTKAESFVDEIAGKVVSQNPRIVGCSSTFQQHTASLALLRRIKELAPQIITILGGANCEGSMGNATHRSFPWVDLVVSGEADELFHPLCQQLLVDGLNIRPDKVPVGVIGPHRTDPLSIVVNGQAHEKPNRAIVHELDKSPIPDYDDYYAAIGTSSFSKYVQPGLLVETSRGCWWGAKHHCTFCGLNGYGMGYRTKSPERALDEIRTLTQRYRINRIEAVDNILSMSYLDTVVPELATEPGKYRIFYEIKANMKRPQLEQMAQAGMRWIQPGIESLNDHLLKLLDKGCNGLMNIRFLKWSRELGMKLIWLFLYDIPGESDDWYAEMADILPLIIHLQPPDGMTRVQYHRFSPYHQRPSDFGVQLQPTIGYSYVYPLDKPVLEELAYFFDDYESEKREKLVPDAKELARRPGLFRLFERLEEWRARWLALAKMELPPTLSMLDEQDKITITDSRPCAVMPKMTLTGPQAWIYRNCESICSLADLERRINGRELNGVTWAEAEQHIEELKAMKLVLELNGRMLSLALREPCAEFPGITPCGHIDLIHYRRDQRFYQ